MPLTGGVTVTGRKMNLNKKKYAGVYYYSECDFKIAPRLGPPPPWDSIYASAVDFRAALAPGS